MPASFIEDYRRQIEKELQAGNATEGRANLITSCSRRALHAGPRLSYAAATQPSVAHCPPYCLLLTALPFLAPNS
jgi:hypothetical protein